MRPIIQIPRVRNFDDKRTGIKVANCCLGPATITDTSVMLNGRPVGKWDRESYELIVGDREPKPKISTLYDESVIPAGGDRFIFFLDDFDPREHDWFWNLIANQISLEILYESIYNGPSFKAYKGPR